MLRALDEKQRMLALLDKLISARGVRVAIGEELGDPGRRPLRGDRRAARPRAAAAGLGVIGPVRMRYDRIIPMVRYVSGKLAPRSGVATVDRHSAMTEPKGPKVDLPNDLLAELEEEKSAKPAAAPAPPARRG